MSGDTLLAKLKNLPPIETPGRTARKYGQIKDRLQTAVRDMPAGARLPPLRKIGEVFDVTLPPVHRAVTELVREGVLYSKPRHGVFVGSKKPAAGMADSVNAAPMIKRLSLLTDSVLPHQNSFWEYGADSFKRKYRHSRVDLAPGNMLTLEGIDRRDIVDLCVPLSLSALPNDFTLLNLETLLGIDALRPFGGAIDSYSPYMAPVQIQVPCLFYNLDLLEKFKAPLPDFDNFVDQAAYLRDMINRFGTENADARPFRDCIGPAEWLGGAANHIYRWLKEDAPDGDRAEFERLLDEVIGILRLPPTWWRSDKSSHPMESFAQNKVAMLITWSYCIGGFDARSLPFRWQARPLLSADNRTYAMLRALAVRAGTAFPMECARFIEHLLTPEVQKFLAHQRGLPVLRDAYDLPLPPALERDADLWRRLPDHISAVFPPNRRHAYVERNIITDELWRCVDTGDSGARALRSILAQGKAFLAQRQGPVF